MGCIGTRIHCLQIFSYILVSIIFTNGQYESLNLGKKLKARELDYGTVLSRPREQLSKKTKLNASAVIIAVGNSGEDVTADKQADVEEQTTASLFTTKCTTNKAITVNQSDLLPTEDPNATEPTDDPNDEPTEDPNGGNSPEDVTNNEVVPAAADETEPPTTKAYDGPKKTHVPDHYLDDV